MIRSYAAIVLLLIAASTPATACMSPSLQCPEPDSVPKIAEAAYRDGNYGLAASLTEASGSLVVLTFAARARNAEAVTKEEGLCLGCLEKAEAIAQTAIGTPQLGSFVPSDMLSPKPDLAEAYVQLAIAIGLRGRLLDASKAQAEGLAEKGRAAIDRALELDPQNVWARASLGGWHLEIVRRAGPVLASVMYGANERDGLKILRTALASEPNNLLLAYHSALTLLALDADRYRSEASKVLLSGLVDPTHNAITAFARKRADTLVELLKAGKLEEVELLVRKFQGYPPKP